MPEAPPTPDAVWTGARLRGAPAQVVWMLLGVEIFTVASIVAALASTEPKATTFVRLGVLVLLCVVFEEIALQVGKLRLLISTGPQPDMTSVWTFAGALVLPAGYAAVLAMVVAIDVWVRRRKASGQYAYRTIYSAATIVLACLSTTLVRSNIQAHLHAIPSAIAMAIAIIGAGLVYTTINRVLVVIAIHLMHPQTPLSMVKGSTADNVLELSTLCLGAMTGIVMLSNPALGVLVLLPMVLLQRGALVKQLETAAAIDAKTGLLNAVAWQEAARRELARLEREQASAGVVLIDLDYFKAVNDDYGHLVGDAALRTVGARLKRELRQYDIIGRFGGEEFVVLLPGLSSAESLAAGERVRQVIASITFADFIDNAPHETADRGLTASVGLSLFPEHGDDLESLLQAADVALYDCKRAGRNRVAVAEIGSGRGGAR